MLGAFAVQQHVLLLVLVVCKQGGNCFASHQGLLVWELHSAGLQVLQQHCWLLLAPCLSSSTTWAGLDWPARRGVHIMWSLPVVQGGMV